MLRPAAHLEHAQEPTPASRSHQPVSAIPTRTWRPEGLQSTSSPFSRLATPNAPFDTKLSIAVMRGEDSALRQFEL